MNLAFPSRLIAEPIIRNALLEDFGLAGDITSASVIPEDHKSTVVLAARQPGVLAGIAAAEMAFALVDPKVVVTKHIADGARLRPADVIATIEGPSRAILSAERTALNFLSHLSGIASVTRTIADSISSTNATVVCTRKTTPGLRALEKYAVRAGGGGNHRYALYDAVLIKDNHIAIAGGVTEAIRRAKASVGHMVKIEVEVDTLDQLEEVLVEGIDAVLLDNMSVDQLRTAVDMVGRKAITEASGRVTPETAPSIATTGVDLISVGWLTHSAPILDIGLDFPQ